MAFDFPASPSEGQIFNAPGGPSYVFNTPVWKAVGQGQIAIISDTPPASPANGALWYESDSGILFIWMNDGSSSQWVQVGGVMGPSTAANVWTDANSVGGLTPNGYQRFKSGVIIQWGQTPGGDAAITFPVAFPNTCLSVVCVPNVSPGALAATQLMACAVESLASAGFTFRIRIVSSGGTVATTATTARWIAVGY